MNREEQVRASLARHAQQMPDIDYRLDVLPYLDSFEDAGRGTIGDLYRDEVLIGTVFATVDGTLHTSIDSLKEKFDFGLSAAKYYPAQVPASHIQSLLGALGQVAFLHLDLENED